jgi:enediyne biosynthesis protein E7
MRRQSPTGWSAQGPRPPGPGLASLGGMCARRAREPFTILAEISRRYGDVVNLPIPRPGTPMTLVGHPDHVHHIMTQQYQSYGKHASLRELVLGEDDVLPMLEGGEEWKCWRRTLNPHFSESGLATVSPAMTTAVTDRIASWTAHAGSGEWIDLEQELATVVADGSMRLMFGIGLEPQRLQRFMSATRDYGKYALIRGLMYAAPAFVPRPFRKRGEAAEAALLEELDRLIDERRTAGPREMPDVLDSLMSMSFQGCPEMQHRRLRADLGGLLLAGFETAAEAVSWSIALLCLNPAALSRAYHEVDALGGLPVEYRHLAELPYLRACFDESQRFQAFPAFIRTATVDDEIGGYFIPKGSDVLVSPYGLHRDPRFWPDPATFKPERFLPPNKFDRNSFLPFNIGPHKCMGWRMAYLEGVLTLAAVLQQYTVDLLPGWTPKPKVNHVTVGLAGGLPAKISIR